MKIIAYITFLNLLLFSCGAKPNVTQLCNPNAEYVDSVRNNPINLYTINNIAEAIDCSKELNIPILTMFTCYVCVGDENVLWEIFSNEEVNSIVSKDYIFVTLYVDDKTKLKEPYTVHNNRSEKELETIGDVNMNREIKKYNMISLPLYAITDFNDADMTEYITYKDIGNNAEGFITFLEKGLEEFYKLHKQ